VETFGNRVLLLDSRYEPTHLLSLSQGFVLMYMSKAEALVPSSRKIQTVNRAYEVPWVLVSQKCRPKKYRYVSPHFSRWMVYLRDHFTCQYCHHKVPLPILTLDHVIPVSRGGQTSWENIITACKMCNLKKGAKDIKELKYKVRPYRPTYAPQALFPLKHRIFSMNAPAPWKAFLDFSQADIFYSECRS
jgi:5-methylcytosine-specific restriction endonuclease McrA